MLKSCFSFRLERKVLFDPVFRPGELEVLPHVGPGELDGD